MQELANARWQTPEEVASPANFLGGRAFAGLGYIAADTGDEETAEKRFEQSINFFFASNVPQGKAIVEDIAGAMESLTGDPAVGQHIRNAAIERWP